MNKCKKCGYEWNGRKQLPKACPKCKRYDWNNGVSKLQEAQNERQD